MLTEEEKEFTKDFWIQEERYSKMVDNYVGETNFPIDSWGTREALYFNGMKTYEEVNKFLLLYKEKKKKLPDVIMMTEEQNKKLSGKFFPIEIIGKFYP